MDPLRFIKKKISKVWQLKFPTILGEVFKVNETIPYDLRIRNELYARNLRTVRYGTETISFLSPKIWALLTQNINTSSSLMF